MAQVVLFHHVLGLTEGIVAFADELRGAGHVVHTPDLFDEARFATIDDGISHADSIGTPTLLARAADAIDGLGADLVYGGFSMGVVPAETLALSRPGARGVLCYYGGIPPEMLELTWPEGLRAQIHTMDGDPFGDQEFSAQMAAEIPTVTYFEYPGTAHLFCDSSTGDYDDAACAIVLARTLEFLDAVGRSART